MNGAQADNPARDALAEKMGKVQINPKWTLADIIAYALVNLQGEPPKSALVTAEYLLRPVAEMVLTKYFREQGNA